LVTQEKVMNVSRVSFRAYAALFFCLVLLFSSARAYAGQEGQVPGSESERKEPELKGAIDSSDALELKLLPSLLAGSSRNQKKVCYVVPCPKQGSGAPKWRFEIESPKDVMPGKSDPWGMQIKVTGPSGSTMKVEPPAKGSIFVENLTTPSPDKQSPEWRIVLSNPNSLSSQPVASGSGTEGITLGVEILDVIGEPGCYVPCS
jgi:hypothetical protein